MKNTILILIAFFAFTFTYSQEWELISTDSEGQEIYMRAHSRFTAWFKTTPVEITTKNNKTVEGYTVQLMKFDCRKKQMGLMAFYEYNKEGSVLDSFQETQEILVEMKYSPPETLGEFMINKFCEE